MEFWKTLFTSSGIATVVSSVFGIIWFLFSKRLLVRWSSEKNKELEVLKGQIADNKMYMVKFSDIQSKMSLIVHDKKLISIELYWKKFLWMKNHFPSHISLLYNILTRSEIENIMKDNIDVISDYIRKFRFEEYVNRLTKETEDLDVLRIYIEPKLWTYFYIYRSLCARLAFVVDTIRKSGIGIHWLEDKGVIQLLAIVLTEEELKNINSGSLDSLNSVFDLIEIKILNEITELTTGNKLSSSHIKDMIEVQNKLRKSEL
ncbi:MAG: hypothetical protein WBG43_10505 [Marinifilaceae bacterium]